MRQSLQRLEIQNLELQHHNEELKSDLRAIALEVKTAKDDFVEAEKELIRMREGCKLHIAGLNVGCESFQGGNEKNKL